MEPRSCLASLTSALRPETTDLSPAPAGPRLSLRFRLPPEVPPRHVRLSLKVRNRRHPRGLGLAVPRVNVSLASLRISQLVDTSNLTLAFFVLFFK